MKKKNLLLIGGPLAGRVVTHDVDQSDIIRVSRIPPFDIAVTMHPDISLQLEHIEYFIERINFTSGKDVYFASIYKTPYMALLELMHSYQKATKDA